MSELPQGWDNTSIANIAEVIMGQSPASSTYNEDGEGLPFFQGKAEFGKLFPTVRKWCSDPTKIAEPNDILLSVRAPVGPTNLASDKCCIGRGLAAIRAIQPLDQKYLLHFLRSIEPWLAQQGTGTTFAAISGEFIRGLNFPLAPLNEQKRITVKLDALLKRVNACRERLDRVPLILKRFRQAVLAAATSGALTEDWREKNFDLPSGDQVIRQDLVSKQKLVASDLALSKKKSSANSEIDPEFIFELPEKWVFTSWGALSEWITYGFTRPMPSVQSGVRLVTAKHVLNFSLQIEDAGYTTIESFDNLSDKDRPQPGDLLITKDGTIGRAALVKIYEPFCINQSVAVCWLRSTTMNKRFLELTANADFTQKFVIEKSKGMAIQHLSITDFAQCPVPVPPLAEQDEIVRRVEKLFAFADKLEARYTTARKQVEQLTPALLAKAFRGELVEQDPNDEPASVLLERIKAEQAGQSTTRCTLPKRIERKAYSPEPKPLPIAAEATTVYGTTIPQRILATMQPGRDYSRADLLTTTGISEAEWLWAIRQLKEEGLVIQSGERRGARYRKQQSI